MPWLLGQWGETQRMSRLQATAFSAGMQMSRGSRERGRRATACFSAVEKARADGVSRTDHQLPRGNRSRKSHTSAEKCAPLSEAQQNLGQRCGIFLANRPFNSEIRAYMPVQRVG